MLLAHQLCLSGMSETCTRFPTLLALGSNQSSGCGDPVSNLRCGVKLLKSRGLLPLAVSYFYGSAPLGHVRQPHFVNAVVAVQSTIPVGIMLRIIKQIERDMGRRSGVRWGPRPLDIDIVSHRGQVASGHCLGWVDRIGSATVWRRGQVTLPHPELHRRAFVLQPICDLMPHWHHPVLNKTAQQLLRNLLPQQSRLVRLAVDNSDIVCNKS
jgi:2-amino-4-hydroxy-6-hydroxymethyldihydropteridine diphosphokinase